MTILRLFLAAVLLTGLAVAADVNGKWTGSIETPNGNFPVNLNLKADGANLTGTITGPQGDIPIQEGKLAGDDVTFNITFSGDQGEFKLSYKGKAAADEIKFEITFGGGGDFPPMQLTVKREK